MVYCKCLLKKLNVVALISCIQCITVYRSLLLGVRRCTDQEKYDYRLVGVVEHLGTMRGGHYVAYVRGAKIKGKTDKENEGCLWYHASDAYVRESSLEEVLRCEAYILFYEQV